MARSEWTVKTALFVTLLSFAAAAVVALSFWGTLYVLDSIEYGRIQIISATYGGNQQATLGNATALLKAACEQKTSCEYLVNVQVLGDPSPGLRKQFWVDYKCGYYLPFNYIRLPEESNGKRFRIAC